MSLLDDEIRAAVFNDLGDPGEVFDVGTLHALEMIDDGHGGWTTEPADHPLLYRYQKISAFFRQSAGIPDSESMIVALQKDVPVKPTTDHQITLRDPVTRDLKRWAIKAVEADQIGVRWKLRVGPV